MVPRLTGKNDTVEGVQNSASPSHASKKIDNFIAGAQRIVVDRSRDPDEIYSAYKKISPPR
jgi:hypothetical protein